jgi:uncharacterized SAM-binding protein YcdF (DUF218 family)
MFLVKKIVTALILPVALSVEMLLAGVCLLLLTRRKRAGKVLLGAGVALLTLLSCNVISEPLLMLFEYAHPPLGEQRLAEWARSRPPGQTRWIVVLGGGHTADPALPATGRIGRMTMVRLAEGIRLYRKVPGSKLLLTGGTTLDRATDADVMDEVARSLGVPAEDIVLEKDSHDTADQARILRGMLADREFILVTSAGHMCRSMALFRKQGMRPIPAPTAHRTHRGTGIGVGDFLPSLGGLTKASKAFYEAIALLWAKIRGYA